MKVQFNHLYVVCDVLSGTLASEFDPFPGSPHRHKVVFGLILLDPATRLTQR